MSDHTCPGSADHLAVEGRPLPDMRTECGRCGSAWCGRCDPAPSAMCHTCNGRGYSTAPLTPSPLQRFITHEMADHQRDLSDWTDAVADGSTILGLAEWLAFRDEHERADMHEEAHTLRRAREETGR